MGLCVGLLAKLFSKRRVQLHIYLYLAIWAQDSLVGPRAGAGVLSACFGKATLRLAFAALASASVFLFAVDDSSGFESTQAFGVCTMPFCWATTSDFEVSVESG